MWTDDILWYELSENTPLNSSQSSQHIGGLANALQILHHYKQEWSEDDVVSIIDEMTSKYHRLWAELLYSPPKKRGHMACTCWSVCMSVTYLFPTNNSRMLWPTFLKLGPYIHPGWQMNPIDFGVNGQGHQDRMCQNCFRSITQERLYLPSSNWSTHPSWIAKDHSLFWGHWVKGQGH